MTEQQLTEQLLAMRATELRAWVVETRARLRQVQIAEQHRVLTVTPNVRDRSILATISDVLAFLDAVTLQIGCDLQTQRRVPVTAQLPAIELSPAPALVIEDLGEGDEDVSRAKTLELVALQQVQRRLKRKGLLRW